MQRRVIAPVATALTLLSLPVAADPVVVELFTSQGCTLCPPADEILHALARHPELIPLALHVDYWDYIGWEDTFANPAFTARQEAYASQAQERMVYTPQIIIGGKERVVGADVLHVMGTVVDYMGQDAPVDLTLSREGDEFHIAAHALTPVSAPLVVQLVRYIPEARVEIERGENAGLTPIYANIVTAWDEVALWDGQADLALSLPADGAEPAVVILQQEGPGEIIASAVLR